MKVKHFSLTLLVVLIFMSVLSDISFAYPTGITGRTLKTTTNGCSSCHNQGNTVTAAFTGSDTVIAGQTYTYTLTLTATSGSGKYGVDIAANTGTLAVISGQGLKLLSGELTHSAAITYVSPKAIQFSYTAPAAPGTDILYATIVRGYTGAYNWAPNKTLVVKTATGIINNEIPVKYYLSQNFPNPFNPTTKINYGLAKASNVKISVFDMTGKNVSTLVDEYENAGNYYVNFNASSFSSGIYYFKIEAGDFIDVKKMTMIK